MSDASKTTKKVLIIKTSSLGDVIHTLPAVNEAKEKVGEIEFDWVVEEALAEIPSWHPAVNRVIPIAIRRWRKKPLKILLNGEFKKFKQQLQQTPYDQIIDAQGLLKSAWIAKLAHGTSFGLDKKSAREPLSARFYDQPKLIDRDQHAIERVRQLFAASLGYDLAPLARFGLDRAQLRQRLVCKSHNPYVILLHGTTWANKHWPEPYWCELCQTITGSGYGVYLFWGNEAERKRAESIAAVSPKAQVLPRMSLAEIASWLAGACAAVSVDTGFGHLAAALNVPTVSLYGPTNPKWVGAWGENQVHLSVKDLKTSDRQTEPQIFAPMTPEYVWKSLVGQIQKGIMLLDGL